MSYTSFLYLAFLAGVFFLYYLFPPRLRPGVLFGANLLFYLASGWEKLLILLALTLLSYLAAQKLGALHADLKQKKADGCLSREELRIEKENNKKKRQRVLTASLALLIASLVFFKYTNFLLRNVYSVLNLLNIAHQEQFFQLVMPMGISFFTFQMIAYLVDVYKGKIEPQRSLWKYALYVSFFPVVVQGPISRYADLGKQLCEEEHRFSWENLREGALLILWGFAKKLVLAERLGLFVDTVYGNYTEYDGVIFILATAAYSIQIYADFSSCMDIGAGTARLFGISLTPNFLRPYFSRTMPEFWRRWHVTLGAWFKDYIFYPISISRFSLKLNKKARQRFGSEGGRILSSAVPILAVWLLTGLWHGAQWKYVAWGLFHGMLILLSMIFTPYLETLSKRLSLPVHRFAFRLFQMLRTFALCCVGRVFFRADSLRIALEIFRRTFAATGFWRLTDGRIFTYGINKANMIVTLAGMLLLLLVSILQEKTDVKKLVLKQNVVIRWGLIYALYLAVLIFGLYGPGFDASGFIYENF